MASDCRCDGHSPLTSAGRFFPDSHNSLSDSIKIHLYSNRPSVHLSVGLCVRKEHVYPPFPPVSSSPLTAGQKNMADVAHERARVAHAGLRNWTIPKLDLEVLDYSVCVSDSLRLVCLPPGAANHIAAAPKAIPE